MNINTTARKSTVRMFDGAGWDTYKVGGKKHKAAEARRNAFNAAKEAKKVAAIEAQGGYTNSELAAGLRAIEVVPSGQAWAAFKAGERNPEVLQALNTEDGLTFKKPATKKAAPKAPKTKPVKVAEVATVAEVAGASFEEYLGRRFHLEIEVYEAMSPVGKERLLSFYATEVAAGLEVAEVEAPKAKGKKAARKARAAAARKGWETRRANAAKAAEGLVEGMVEPMADDETSVETATERKAAKKAAKKAKAAVLIVAEVDPAEEFRVEMTKVGLTDAQIAKAWSLKVAK